MPDPQDTQNPQIEGLPPGAILKPLAQSAAPQIEGLPAGAVLRPIKPVQNVNTSPATPAPDLGRFQGVSELGTGVLKGAKETLRTLGGWAGEAFGSPNVKPEDQPLQPFKGEDLGAKTPLEVGGKGVEEVGEWMAGDAALEGVARLAKIAKNAPHLIEIIDHFPKASKAIMALGKGAAVGGAQGAVKEGSLEGAGHGAEGGALGAAAGEVVGAVAKPVLKSFGIGTSSIEDAMRAAQPGKRNIKFSEDWVTAQPRLAKELEEGGTFKDMGEAADRIGDVRRKLWTDEIEPAIGRHADEVFDTTGVAQSVRSKITPALEKNFPEDAKSLREFADKYTSGTPLFSGDKTVAEAEKEIELYNAKLTDEGYWNKAPKARAAMERANPKIAAWRAASDAIREGLYTHLDTAGEPGMAALKNEYGAIGNIENEVRGRENVAGRQVPLSMKKIIGLTSGMIHGGPAGIAAAALPFIDAWWNSPQELLGRAIAKGEPAGPIKQAVQKVAKAAAPVAKAAAGVGGENLVRFIASDGSQHSVNADQWDKVQQIDPGAKKQD